MLIILAKILIVGIIWLLWKPSIDDAKKTAEVLEEELNKIVKPTLEVKNVK